MSSSERLLSHLNEIARDFSIEMAVVPNGPLDGVTVEIAGLRHLSNVFLASLERGDTVIAPAQPTTILLGGDRLRFVGRVDQVLDLQGIKGLDHVSKDHIDALTSAQVSATSPLRSDTTAHSSAPASRNRVSSLAIRRPLWPFIAPGFDSTQSWERCRCVPETHSFC